MPYLVVPWEHIAPNYHRGTILLGNGASIAVSPSFGYGSLLDHAQRAGLLGVDVQQLFGSFGTSDFELILRLVWQASNVNRSLQIPDNRTHQAYLNVRECLIQAVRDVHPAYDLVSGHLPSMYQFLKGFDTVISLNYDLLVYWTMTYGLDIQDGHLFKDCFLGSGMFDDAWQRFRAPYRERTNTLVFYPHGSLALCRTVVEQEFKIHNAGEGLLEAILAEWRSERVVPLFVSEGTMLQKVSSIQNSYYLSTVYREVLTPRVTILVVPIGPDPLGSGFIDGGGRLWSLWSKVGAVGNADALSTASRPVREAHRPQIHSLVPAPKAPAPCTVASTTRGRG